MNGIQNVASLYPLPGGGRNPLGKAPARHRQGRAVGDQHVTVEKKAGEMKGGGGLGQGRRLTAVF